MSVSVLTALAENMVLNQVILKADRTVTPPERFTNADKITDVCQGLGWWMYGALLFFELVSGQVSTALLFDVGCQVTWKLTLSGQMVGTLLLPYMGACGPQVSTWLMSPSSTGTRI